MVKKRVKAIVKKMKESGDKNKKYIKYQVGQYVLVRNHKLSNAAKA